MATALTGRIDGLDPTCPVRKIIEQEHSLAHA